MLSTVFAGTLSVDEEAIRSLGVEMGFWVAASLAFLEYLQDRDVSAIFLPASLSEAHNIDRDTSPHQTIKLDCPPRFRVSNVAV